MKVFTSLDRNPKWPKQEFRVRIVRYFNTNSILLDIREYVTSEVEGLSSGYTKKGFSITSKQFRHLLRMSPAILKHMERMEHELLKQESKDAVQEDKQDSTEENRVASSSKEIREENPDTGGTS